MVGVTGLEPVTLRLSSACSNQLSYTPRRRALRHGGQARLNSALGRANRLKLPGSQAGLPAVARDASEGWWS